MSQSQRRDQIIVLLGGCALLLFVILSWVPRRCPVLRQVLTGCPTVPLAQQTPEEREINRIPHQVVDTSLATFEVAADTNRAKTRVAFLFRTPTTTIATLQIQRDNGFEPLATVTHPLLATAWSRTTVTEPSFTLLRKDADDTRDITTFVASRPEQLAADAAAAAHFDLSATRYAELERTTELGGITAILVSHSPLAADGSWHLFEQEFNLSDVPANADNKLLFSISIHRANEADQFLLGSVHVDYRK